MRIWGCVGAWWLLMSGLASAAPPSITRPVLLPTRRADASALAARTQTLARVLDERRGAAGASSPTAALDLGPTLDRANEVLAAGKVDDAAVLLDMALDLGARSPARVSSPSAFLHAHILRASVALARREAGRAQALLTRALAYDPTLTLSVEESSPRVRALFDEVRRALGPHPALDAQALGDLARARVLVARAAPNGELELALFENGSLVASLATAGGRDDEEILRLLDGAGSKAVPASSRPVAAVAAVAAPTAPALSLPPPPPTPHDSHRRLWLWAALPVGVVVVGGVLVAIFVARSAAPSASSDWNVGRHF